MTEKSHKNTFKFGLYQANQTITETIFTADVFNPVVRYSVDIRNDISSIISRLQKTLSRRNLTYKADVGGDKTYDFLKYYKDVANSETKPFQNILDLPKTSKHNINGRTVSGVEFKFGLYINNNPIVERNFYVEGYNPASRLSLELGEVVNEISKEIYHSLKESDVNHMWDDYDLIHTYGLYINQVRELSKGKRQQLLANINDRNYVKKVKRGYRS